MYENQFYCTRSIVLPMDKKGPVSLWWTMFSAKSQQLEQNSQLISVVIRTRIIPIQPKNIFTITNTKLKKKRKMGKSVKKNSMHYFIQSTDNQE